MFPQIAGSVWVFILGLVSMIFTYFPRLHMFITGGEEEEVPLVEESLPEEPLEEEQVPENVEIRREVERVNQIRRQQLVRIEVCRINKLGRQQIAKAKQAEKKAEKQRDWEERNRILHAHRDRPKPKPGK